MGANGGAPLLLAAASYAGKTGADARLLEQMRFSITGGNDITANGGYPAQHERYITGMYAVARCIPRIWNQLTDEEKHKIDLVMKAALVSSAWVNSDENPHVKTPRAKQYAVDGDGNMNRDWNPNFREGMVGGLIHGICYFGPEKATAIVKEYDHEKFIAELEAAGLKNIHETFSWKKRNPESTAPDTQQIEQALHNFKYKGMDLSDPMPLYHELVGCTFAAEVSAGLNDGRGIDPKDGKGPAGVILSGADKLPNKGQRGMLTEFASVDAGGPRSSTLYAWDGFRCNIVNQYVIIATGYWKDGPEADESIQRIRVGATDLFYKLEHGYANYAKGKRQGPLELTNKFYGFQFLRPLWDNVLEPYHAKKK